MSNQDEDLLFSNDEYQPPQPGGRRRPATASGGTGATPAGRHAVADPGCQAVRRRARRQVDGTRRSR